MKTKIELELSRLELQYVHDALYQLYNKYKAEEADVLCRWGNKPESDGVAKLWLDFRELWLAALKREKALRLKEKMTKLMQIGGKDTQVTIGKDFTVERCAEVIKGHWPEYVVECIPESLTITECFFFRNLKSLESWNLHGCIEDNKHDCVYIILNQGNHQVTLVCEPDGSSEVVVRDILNKLI